MELELRGITKKFPGVVANDDVNLKLATGEVLALIGENGAGKSTLMSILYGMYRPDGGTITLDGVDITRLPTHAIARLGIAQSPEGRRVFPRMTVYENL
ncbi:MAG: ATP-binding cassette domain-containing protein, partial [Actinobacteria bacterium]|nr:ATP-binding cassette domain-containing protein [Actinomycetota bacterium]